MLKNRREQAADELGKLLVKGEDFAAANRKIAKKFGVSVLRKSEALDSLRRQKKDPMAICPALRKRAVRTSSGIAPVAALTKPCACPGECVYCPSEKGVPQSYLSNEPAVMRAIRCHYDPYTQVWSRIRALETNGHRPEKIELIIIGGTWSALPEKYRYWFILECFRAANEYENLNYCSNPSNPLCQKDSRKNPLVKGLPAGQAGGLGDLKKLLFREQKINEESKYKIIGLTIETRPDRIDEKEIRRLRELGATRIELGVQAIDDRILEKNKRGHDTAATARATALLKTHGFKITYHIMPGLPGSSPKRDLEMYRSLFSDPRFQPDQIKFYPTVVTKNSLLYRWWRAGKYRPYSGKKLENLIANCKVVTPEYVRIIRLIRDIPEESIVAGNKITNLRQIMKDRKIKCRCIRCREPGNLKLSAGKTILKTTSYRASSGREYFLSFESTDGRTIYGFCRLRINNDPTSPFLPPLKNAALIRELHVYGELVPVGERKKIQQAGLGKKLTAEAERIAENEGLKKIAVISGVGVRGYYRKLGYRREETYMTKKLTGDKNKVKIAKE